MLRRVPLDNEYIRVVGRVILSQRRSLMGKITLTDLFGYVFLVASLLSTFSLLFKSMRDNWSPKDRVNQVVVLIVISILGAMIGGALLIAG